MRQFGVPEEEICLGAVARDDLCKNAPLDVQIQVLFLQLFPNSEDLIEDTGIFRVDLLKTKGKCLTLALEFWYERGIGWRRGIIYGEVLTIFRL